jgi:hypothetical protein
MPKLNGTHLPERLASRLADLKSGKEVAARDIKALLSAEQIAHMDTAWAAQQALRKQKRARTKEEEVRLGWKSKREIHIEAYEKALVEAEEEGLSELQRLQWKATVRQSKIYLDTYFTALDEGKTTHAAESLANNNLTRAKLNRLDGRPAGVQGLTKRDREIRALEAEILGERVPKKKGHQNTQLDVPQKGQKPSGKRARKP